MKSKIIEDEVTLELWAEEQGAAMAAGCCASSAGCAGTLSTPLGCAGSVGSGGTACLPN